MSRLLEAEVPISIVAGPPQCMLMSVCPWSVRLLYVFRFASRGHTSKTKQDRHRLHSYDGILLEVSIAGSAAAVRPFYPVIPGIFLVSNKVRSIINMASRLTLATDHSCCQSTATVVSPQVLSSVKKVQYVDLYSASLRSVSNALTLPVSRRWSPQANPKARHQRTLRDHVIRVGVSRDMPVYSSSLRQVLIPA